MAFEFQPVGIIHSPFKEKFGLPRQSGLIEALECRLELLPPYDREEALRGLEDFSHIWLIFVFHQHLDGGWKPTVRPPRLGGNRRLGVFASRASYRPNPIGLSAVELKGVARENGRLQLRIKGCDLVEGTPVLDIKPYLPYADRIDEATGGFAPEAPETRMDIVFTDEAETAIRDKEAEGLEDLHVLIKQLLQYDPRPAYQGADTAKRRFGIRLHDFDLIWDVEDTTITVIGLRPPKA